MLVVNVIEGSLQTPDFLSPFVNRMTMMTTIHIIDRSLQSLHLVNRLDHFLVMMVDLTVIHWSLESSQLLQVLQNYFQFFRWLAPPKGRSRSDSAMRKRAQVVW